MDEIEKLKAQLNTLTAELAKARKEGEAVDAIKKEIAQLKSELAEAKKKADAAEAELAKARGEKVREVPASTGAAAPDAGVAAEDEDGW